MGWASARLVTMFTVPATLDSGGMPDSSTLGPRSTSMRSNISTGTALAGAMPYRPLVAMSIAPMSRPRRLKFCSRWFLLVVKTTAESFSSTSCSVSADQSSASSRV